MFKNYLAKRRVLFEQAFEKAYPEVCAKFKLSPEKPLLKIANDYPKKSAGVACYYAPNPNKTGQIHISRFTLFFLPEVVIAAALSHEIGHHVHKHYKIEYNQLDRYVIRDKKDLILVMSINEGIASTLFSRYHDLIKRFGFLNGLKSKLFFYVAANMQFFSNPSKTSSVLLRLLIRPFMPDKLVASLVDHFPDFFSFLINPNKDGEAYVARHNCPMVIATPPPLSFHELLGIKESI